MTKEQFRNKYVGKVVHCDTEEKAKEFLALAHEFGCAWKRKVSLGETYWDEYKKDTCYRIDNDKKMSWSNLNYYNRQGSEVVEFESEEKKMKKTKKVFDLGLYVDSTIGRISQEETLKYIRHWALKSHGKTKEEMAQDNKLTSDVWMKEVEVEVDLSEKEIEVLKALKVLGFEWIARDENDCLFAYDSKPIKLGEYYDGTRYVEMDMTLFEFITWEDEEPTSIEELLKEC